MSVLWCTTYDSGGSTASPTRLNVDTMLCIDGSSGGRDIIAPVDASLRVNGAVTGDNDEIYYGALFGQQAAKLNHKTLLGVVFSTFEARYMTADENFIYAYNYTTAKIKKYNKTTGAFIQDIYTASSSPTQMHYYNGYIYLAIQSTNVIVIIDTNTLAVINLTVGASLGATRFLRGFIFDASFLYCSFTYSSTTPGPYSEAIIKYDFALPGTIRGIAIERTIFNKANSTLTGLAVSNDNLFCFCSDPSGGVPFGHNPKSFLKFSKDLVYERCSLSYQNTTATQGWSVVDDWQKQLIMRGRSISYASGRGRPRRFIQGFNPANIT